MTSRRAVSLTLALGGLLFLWSYHDVGLNYSDEGLAIDSARRILRGQLVVRDFGDLPSGLHYVYAALFKLRGGVDLVALRGGLAVLKAGLAVLLFWTGCRLMPARWALVPALLAVAVSGPFLKAPLVGVYIVFVHQGLRLLEAPTRRRAAAAGAALGLLFFLRFDVVLSILICSAPWLLGAWRQGVFRHWPALAAAFAGVLFLCLVPPLAVCTGFDWNRGPALADLFSWAGWEQAVTARVWQAPHVPLWRIPMLMAHDLLGILGCGFGGFRDWFMALAGVGPPIQDLQEHLQLLSVDLFVVALALLAWWLARHPDLQATLVAGVGAAALLKYLHRPDFAHFAQGTPQIALCYALAAYRVWSGKWAVSALPRLLVPAVGAAAAALLLTASAWQEDFYAGTIGILRTAQTRLVYPGLELRVSRAEADDLAQLVEYVTAHRRPWENLGAVPHCPLVYYLFGTDAPGCYSVFYLTLPAMVRLKEIQEDQGQRVMREQRVRFVVQDLDPAWSNPTIESLLPKLAAIVKRRHSQVFCNRRFRVWDLMRPEAWGGKPIRRLADLGRPAGAEVWTATLREAPRGARWVSRGFARSSRLARGAGACLAALRRLPVAPRISRVVAATLVLPALARASLGSGHIGRVRPALRAAAPRGRASGSRLSPAPRRLFGHGRPVRPQF